PARADPFIVRHGHFDHYGALPDLARVTQGKLKPGITLYAGGEDTFCHRVVVTPAGSIDYGTLDRPALEAHGLKVVFAKQPAAVAGHAFVTGQIARITDFEKPPAAARLMTGPMDSACTASHFGATSVVTKPGELVADIFQGELSIYHKVKYLRTYVILFSGHACVTTVVS